MVFITQQNEVLPKKSYWTQILFFPKQVLLERRYRCFETAAAVAGYN